MFKIDKRCTKQGYFMGFIEKNTNEIVFKPFLKFGAHNAISESMYLVKQYKKPVIMQFNGVTVKILPTHTATEIMREYSNNLAHRR